MPLRTSSATTGAEDGPGRSFEGAHRRGVVRHELLREAMGALSRLGEELVDVDARLEDEGLRLVDEWHLLKVSVNLERL